MSMTIVQIQRQLELIFRKYHFFNVETRPAASLHYKRSLTYWFTRNAVICWQ